jgi:hypothetical protein
VGSSRAGSSKRGSKVKQRRRVVQNSPLDGLTASVIVERGEGCVRVDGVKASDSFAVLGELLEAMRLMTTRYPELLKELQPVAGYAPLEVHDDDYAEQGRQVGFRASKP